MNAFAVILLSLGASAAMHLGYQKGQRYTYNYEGEVYHAIPGESAKTLGLRVRCQAHFDVFKKTEIQITLTNIEVHQVTGNQKDPKQKQEMAADEKVLKAMQHKLFLPVRVSFKAQDGSIKEISVHPNDEEWSLNIKRGLVNLLQVSPHATPVEKYGKQFVTQHESTAVGECQVYYVINEDNSHQHGKYQVVRITKVINYDKCRHRPEYCQNTFYGQRCEDCKLSYGYAPYLRSVGQIDHTLTGFKDSGYIIDRTEAFEQQVITPFSRSGGQVITSTRQTLHFLKKDHVGPASTELTKKCSHMFYAENPDKRAREDDKFQQKIYEQVEKSIDEMCKAAKDPAKHFAAQKFADVVYHLRKCNKVTVEKLAEKMLARQDQTERRYCLDALSFVGTSEAFQVLKNCVQQNKISKQEELQRVFLGLAYAPRPNAYHIEAAWELCKLSYVTKDVTNHRHCLLSFGALVYKINQRPEQDTKTVTGWQQHVKEILNKLADPKTPPQYMLTYIKTLGNAGSTEAREQLLKYVKDQKQPLYIRVNCVWALRRIAPQARDKTYPRLVTTFADAREYPELRMAAFLLMLNSGPNFATLQALVNTVYREITNPLPGPRSNQLASFVVSHLSALAYYDNVLMKKRSMQARMVLRLMPRTSFGLGYSKGMRFAQHSEKFQAGFELEANKFDVPESMLPRNMNARLQFHLLGYKMNALEFGTRVENMDDVIEQLISQVRRRQKRSVWGSVMSWLGKESSGSGENLAETKTDSTRSSTRYMSFRRRSSASGPSSSRPSSRPTSHPTGPSTRPHPTYPTEDNGEAQKQRRVSAYLKLFGDEVKFVEMKQENIDKLANDIADLLLGKKDHIEYPNQGITIAKDGVHFQQSLEKAIMVANARRMLPTLAGIPLDMHLRSSAALKVIAAVKMTVAPSLMSFWHFQKITGFVEVKPSFHFHADTRIGIHTPFMHVGLQMNHDARANHDQKADVEFEAGKQYKLTYNIPQERRDVVHIKSNTYGFVEQYMPDTYERKKAQQISLELNTHHLKTVEKTCTGKDMFGVQFCTEGKYPDFASLRLQQIPCLPTIAQTEVRVSMEPASDKPAHIQCINKIEKNDEKEFQILGEIFASSKAVSRRLPYRVTYKKAGQKQLEFETKVIEVQGWEDYIMKFYANQDGVKVQFGKGKTEYQITASGQIKDQGKSLYLQAEWTELPQQWKKLFYDWQPQIWYILQQFAWIRRTDQQTKQIAFEFQLTSPLTANLRLRTPDAEAERTDLSLPVRIDHFPQSIQEIKNYFFAKCEVHDQSIRMFDQLQYQHNIRGGCPYVLVQENFTDKPSRIQLFVKIDEKGQKTVMASIQEQQQSKETVQVHPDFTILIDGEKQECSQKTCQSKQKSATVRKTQTSDGRTRVELSTKYGLHATIEGQLIHVYASPLLRSHVHGLCGNADGEQWNEYKDPQGHVQKLQKFIQSWQQKC